MTSSLYSFDEIPRVRSLIYDRVKDTIASSFPIEDDNFRLEVADLKYEGDDNIDPKLEKEFVVSGYTLAKPLRGVIRLIDKKTGKVVSEAKKRLAAVPYLTNRGTFIINGVEYGLINQARLRPGVYTRLAITGEYEALVNVAGGYGHRYVLDPKTGVFYVTRGQARIPLLPLLEALGVPSDTLIRYWGREIYTINKQNTDSRVMERLYTTFAGKSPDAGTDIAKELQKIFSEFKFDPSVTRITLGKEVSQFTPEVPLLATAKLLAAAQGRGTTDDINHTAFLRVYGPEEYFASAVKKGLARLRKRYLSARAKRDVNAIDSGIFDENLVEAVHGSGLGTALEEVNPLEILDNRYRVTRLGEGGIGDINAVAESIRYLHPSHLGYIDPVFTPEGENVGVDNRFTFYTKRDDNGNVYTPFIDAKTKKQVYLRPIDIFNKVVTFPGELESGRKFVRAIFNNQHILVRPNMVDYVLPYSDAVYSPLTNLIPMKQNAYGQRVSMGARMLAQAVPLVEAEAPLVRNAHSSGKSYDEIFGEYFRGTIAPVSGEVRKVEGGKITIRGDDGKLYRVSYYEYFPYNRKTFYSEIPIVQPGMRVKSGQPLTKSNYVDESGTLSLGLNLKTAYMAFEGFNFEDAAILSESAAKKLASEHAYQFWHDRSNEYVYDRNKFQSIFPGKYKREFYENYDSDGVIKPGTVVTKNTPLALLAKADTLYGRRLYSDDSILWEHEDEGVVTDVIKGPKSINVVVRSVQKFKVGDKIAGRYGDKHIVGAILPDDQMPKDENGEPFELILNPLGVQGRANPAQIWEAILSKVARKTGKPILIPDHAINMVEFVDNLLKEHGIKDKEEVYVDKYNTKFPVLTGYRYMMKLHHMAESKLSGRGTGGYSMEETPVKGGFEGAKRIGLLEMLGLLAHGAYNVARDARVIRGQANPLFWDRISLGYDIPSNPDVPFVYDKFLNHLIAAGLHPVERGTKLRIYALTNSAIKELTKDRYLENGEAITVRGDGITPIKGGLFDPEKTGGLSGTLWSAIKLPEPILNPLLESPIANLLGLNINELRNILFGRKDYGEFGTGPQAIREALSRINIDQTLNNLTREIGEAAPSKRDALIRKYRFLSALKENKISPGDLFWESVPVLPPVFRAVGFMAASKLPLISDANYLYKTVFDISRANAQLKAHNALDPKDRELLYNAVKALVGLTEPVDPKQRSQNIKGIIPQIIGPSPKLGVVQKKLLGATVDLVGRATIIPNPNLGIDEVAIPERSAWEIYKPFVIRRLVKAGYSRIDAVNKFLNRDPVAKEALLKEMQTRPVLISRAPVLHKHGIMAAWPRLTQNNVMEIPPFLVSAFGADFDGDAMQFHVPADHAAVKEAVEKLLPSKNLFTLQNFQVHIAPTMEYLGGLYYLSSQRGKGAPVHFATKEEFFNALRTGKIRPDQNVIIMSE